MFILSWRKGQLQRILALQVLLVALLSSSAMAAFELSSKTVLLDVERGSTIVWSLKTDESLFKFVAPLEWRVNWTAEKKMIVMTSTDGGSVINVQFSTAPTEADPEVLKKKILGKFQNAKVVEEFVCYSASGEGRAFELEVTRDNRTLPVRVAVILTKGETVEFTLQSSVEKLDSNRLSLAALLNSFEHVKEAKTAK